MKGWRTVLFNVFMGGWMALEAVDWTQVLDTPEKVGLAGLFMGIGNLILRYYTTTSIGKSE